MSDTPILPGDFLLVDQPNDSIARLVRFGQRLRYHGSDAIYAKWNHVALFVTEHTLIEANGRTVAFTSLENYQHLDTHIVHIGATAPDRAQAVKFAMSCLHDKYGWLTIASIAFSLVTGSRISVGLDGEEICSGLVARALERTDAIFPRDASHMTPADLAMYYGVR